MKIVILVLARGGSKGIPKKNIKPLNGKPLISYIIEEAKKLPYPIYVSTEDIEIKGVAERLGVSVIKRPIKYAKDTSKSLDTIKHANYLLRADYIVLLNACVPFTKTIDIQSCIDLAIETKCDSVVSLVEDFSSHPSKICNLVGNKIYPIYTGFTFQTGERQQLSKTYKRNTAIYVISKSNIRKNTLLGKNIIGYIMPPERSIDINTQWDWFVCEAILNWKQYLEL